MRSVTVFTFDFVLLGANRWSININTTSYNNECANSYLKSKSKSVCLFVFKC